MASESPDESKVGRIFAEQRQYMVQREKGYRERALKLYPWICGRCRREFTRQNLRELTVHHINHDHGYNPPDGSNWELLCIYCHDEEHSKFESFVRYGGGPRRGHDAPATSNPFAGLKDAIKDKKVKDDG
ncbi:MAG: YajD family HNH nuclease [Salinisphaera sp.]|uniref:YajD family HNH nuclease n=1 Tax=Salinisphaera sp. TaxID=1914330 RepID=UPI003C79F374